MKEPPTTIGLANYILSEIEADPKLATKAIQATDGAGNIWNVKLDYMATRHAFRLLLEPPPNTKHK